MAADYFLKIDGIKGESKDHKHKDEIELESWSWGESQTGTMSHAGGGGAGKVSMHDFHFVMKINCASPDLMLHCANGKHIPSALLTCRKAGGKQEEFLTIKFTDLLISSYQIGGSSHGSDIPGDQISFNYTKINVEYKEQLGDGKLGSPKQFGWDVKANQKI